jgi:hypothetical protein
MANRLDADEIRSSRGDGFGKAKRCLAVGCRLIEHGCGKMWRSARCLDDARKRRLGSTGPRLREQ